MSRAPTIPLALAALLAAAPAAAGIWFDLGGGQTVVVHANGAPASHETYPPFAFGLLPPGSLVYQDMSPVGCEALGESGQICGESRFVAGYRCTFSGASRGSGWALLAPTRLRLGYDSRLVFAAGASEEALRLYFRDPELTDWTPVPGAVLDPQADAFTVSWHRHVLGTREFAIVNGDLAPVIADSWGRVKVIYRR